jgi:glycosyltransferase involved in cell wall biosynthesis
MTPDIPLVSTIIATYNRRDYVYKAIESALNQTYSNVEVIVIDDGSTDGTGDLLQEKYGERIRYFWQENRGRSEARNEGIRLAKGKYIAFLDSDDLWKKEKLSHQILQMEQQPECGFSHTFIDNFRDNFVSSDEAYNQHVDREYVRALKRGYTYSGMSRHCTMFWSTVVVRKDVALETGLLDSSCETYEDWDWYLRASLVTCVTTIGERLTWYRLHEGNSSTHQFNRGLVALAHKHLENLESIPYRIRWQVRRDLYLQLATVAYYREDKKECRHWFLRAISVNPLIALAPQNVRLVATALLPKFVTLPLRHIRRRIRS